MSNKPEEQGFKQGFGKSKAAICLADMLLKPEYEKCKGAVAAILQGYNHTINQVSFSNIEDKTKITLFQLIRKDFERCLFETNLINLPYILKSYLFNILKTNYKMAIQNKYDRNNVSKKYYELKKYE